MRRRLVHAAAVLAIVAGLLFAVRAPTPLTALDALTPVERMMGDWANGERAYNRLPPMVFDGQMQEQAVAHARRMAATGRFEHSPQGELYWFLDPAYNGWRSMSENIAYAYSADPLSLYQVHLMWMRSPGHRDNLLAAGNKGMGVAVAAGHGRVWIAAEYAGF